MEILFPNSFDAEAAAIDVRERSIRAVLSALRARPRSSRAELAAATGLSKPTVASALDDLIETEVVRTQGRTTGRRGPSAQLYETVASAVQALAVHIGAHRVRAARVDMDGTQTAETSIALTHPDGASVLAALSELRDQIDPARPVELAVIGSPGILEPDGGRIRSSPNIAGWEGISVQTAIGRELGLPVLVENDVNLAALGEHMLGAGRGCRSFAYLNIGSGLGAGLVLDGRLYRGHHGAAGEVGYLSTGGTATLPTAPMEELLSARALARYASDYAADAPRDPTVLLDLARRGDPLGTAVIVRLGDALTQCIASLAAVVDLELVLLGGGIGTHADLLIEPTQRAVSQRVPYAPTIRTGALGDGAVLAGAAAVGARAAVDALIARIA
jgi:predicted NBD/HSP70 family sugar kinase